MEIFDQVASQFFESLFYEKLQPIRRKHEVEQHKIDWSNAALKLQLSIVEHQRFMNEFIEARVEAYIETCLRIGKHPTESDYRQFSDELVTLAEYRSRTRQVAQHRKYERETAELEHDEPPSFREDGERIQDREELAQSPIPSDSAGLRFLFTVVRDFRAPSGFVSNPATRVSEVVRYLWPGP